MSELYVLFQLIVKLISLAVCSKY